MKKILVVGSLNMDLVVQAPRHPKVGETIFGSQFHTFPGGKGANQAVAAARIGAPVTMIGRVGADGFGQQLLEIAAQEGIDAQWIEAVSGQPTGLALITVSDDGQNSIVVISGANTCLTTSDLDAAECALDEAAALVLQLEVPMPVNQRAVELAHQKNIPVLLNPAPAQQIPLEILRQVDILIPNQHGLLLISNQPDMESAIQSLLGLGVKQLLVTLGEDGALLVSAQERQHIPAFKVTPVDTTAAGDAFVGALAVALTQGQPLPQAARFASAAAAISVTRPGAQPSLPIRSEVEKFLKEQNA